ncbi:restriction endonuclease-like protein [Neobacillus mesonae]|nr:restriction endonuclease-like protein [Neobacillus mesonae]
MGSPHIGFLNHSVELIRIETNLFNLYIQGKPYHPTVESLQLHRDDVGAWMDSNTLQISSLSSELELESISVFSPEQGQLVSWKTGEKSYPLFYETQSYELVIEKKQGTDLTFYHDNLYIRQAVKPLGQSILSGILNFQNEVGLTELELRHNGRSLFQMQIEIYPSKIDYKKDYQMILSDINRQIYNLSFDFLRKTYHLTGLKETRKQSLTEFFTILQHVFDQLRQAVERIHANPHYSLVKEQRIVDSAKVRKAGKENIAFLSKRPYLLSHHEEHGFIPHQGQSLHPSHALETKRRVQFDTLENRFVRWVLIRVSKKLQEMKRKLSGSGKMQDPILDKRITSIQNQLQRLLQLDFLKVGEMKQLSVSLVLQMAPGYREVYRSYLMLMKGLSVQSDLFRLSMKDLAQLYEYWCFLKINELLGHKYELLKQDMIKVNRTGVFFTLDKSQSAKMEYRNPKNGEIFTLYYNALPRGDRSATLGQRPDNVLTLKKNDSAMEYKYIFDAKYRIDPAYEGTYYYEKYKRPGPVEEDINTMHRYRDAIVYSEGGQELERSMFGAYVLFPYPDEVSYREHKFYKSIELVNVGAFPFLPNATELMDKFLEEIIMDSPEKAYERSTRPRGTNRYYKDKLAGKNVLVGSLREVAQLQSALEHGYYHLPLENISDHKILTQIEYIALYQSKGKFADTGEMGVNWYGKIQDWKVLRREEIKERPARKGMENQLYIKFSIEEWIKREEPIESGGLGIYRLLYTSKYIFDRAKEIAELKLETEEQLSEWREKRRRGVVKVELDHTQVDLAKQIKEIRIDE